MISRSHAFEIWSCPPILSSRANKLISNKYVNNASFYPTITLSRRNRIIIWVVWVVRCPCPWQVFLGTRLPTSKYYYNTTLGRIGSGPPPLHEESRHYVLVTHSQLIFEGLQSILGYEHGVGFVTFVVTVGDRTGGRHGTISFRRGLPTRPIVQLLFIFFLALFLRPRLPT
jgi:hypothetical protein